MSSFEEILKKGNLICPIKGVSMRPLFNEERDRVVIVPLNGRLKKNDIALFKRGDDYVLHRVVKVKAGCYDFLGDNSLIEERSVSEERVLGKAIGYFKGEKYKKHLKNPFYLAFVKSRFFMRRVIRKLKGLFKKKR